MEKVVMTKNSKRYRFKAGDTFVVKRNINGLCVVIRTPDMPNLVLSERQTRYYGTLSGKSQLGP